MKIKDWIKCQFNKEYRLYNHKIYLDLGFHKLFKYLHQIKNIDEKPHLKFYKGDCGFNIWCDYYMDIHTSYNSFINKWFAIHVEPLGYKYKWGYFTFTYAPEIVCVFNKKIIFTIRLEASHGFWQNVVDIITSQKKG